MQTAPRQAGFGRRAASIRRPAAIASPPVELHHAPGKLVLRSLLCGAFALGGLWTVASGGLGADYHGRDAALFRLLGPQGTMLFFALFRLCCAALCIAYLRLLASGDRLAARATADGRAINGVWGRLSYEWRDGRDIPFIAIERFDGGTKRVPVNTIIGGRAAVETWIGDAQAWLCRP